MGFCKYCGASIDWIRTLDDSLLPVDEEPVFVVEGGGQELFYECEGTPIIGRLAAENEQWKNLPIGFIPHFRSCRSCRKTAG